MEEDEIETAPFVAAWSFSDEEGDHQGTVVVGGPRDDDEQAIAAAAGAGIVIRALTEHPLGPSVRALAELADELICRRSKDVQVGTVDGTRLNNLERDVRNMRRDVAGITTAVNALADLIRGGVVQQVAAEITAERPRAQRGVDVELEDRSAEYEPGEDRGAPPPTAKMPILGKPDTQPVVNRRLSAAAREVAMPTLAISGERRSEVQRFNGSEWVTEPLPKVGNTLHNRSDIIPRAR